MIAVGTVIVVWLACQVVIGIGLAYQYVATKVNGYRFPPIGQMIDVGGYRLHIYRSGPEKGPTIVLDAGCGFPGKSWTLVQPGIAEFTNVISYDRAGYGWSDSGPNPRTSAQIVKELHELVTRTNMPKPYILVGHSLGGMNARLYTSMYPEDIVGVILVDSPHENQYEKLPKFSKFDCAIYKLVTVLGITRLIFLLKNVINIQKMTKLDQQLLISQLSTTKHINTFLMEAQSFSVDREQIKTVSSKMTEKLLTVITAGKPQPPIPENCGIMKSDKIIKELQRDLASKSKYGKQIIAENSGHDIPFEQPEIIVQAVHDMIEYLKKNKNDLPSYE